MSQKFSFTDLARIPLAESSGGTYKVTAMHLLKLTGPVSSVSTGMQISALSTLFSEVSMLIPCGPFSTGSTYGIELVGSTVGSANVTSLEVLLRVYSTGLLLSADTDASGSSWLAVLGGVAAK